MNEETKIETRDKPDFQVLQRISDLRTERNWTEYELSRKSDIPQSTISSWFKKRTTPTIPMIEKICRAYGLSLSQFFSDTNKEAETGTEEKALLDAWGRMTVRQRKALINLLDSFLESKHEKKNK